MLKAVIFDMDGVIAHTNPFHMIAFKKFFEKRNMFPPESELVEHMYGKSNSYIFSYFFKRPVAGEELLSLEKEKEGLFRKIYASEVKEIPGFSTFCNRLKTKGIKLGVATSAPKANMDLILDQLHMTNQFDSRLASEDVIDHKPNPEVYLKSAQNLGARPTECLVFEDSKSGIQAALNADMRVVGVLSSHQPKELPPCHLFIEDFNNPSLYEYIRSLSLEI